MKTETIEWFTPAEKMPECGKDLLLIMAIDRYDWIEGQYNEGLTPDGIWSQDGYGSLCAAPVYWAYKPKGPE